MDRTRLEYLLERFKNGRSTEEENAELNEFYQSLGKERNLPDDIEHDTEAYKLKRYALLREAINSTSKSKSKSIRLFWQKAAIVLLFIAIGGITFYIVNNSLSHVQQLPATLSYNAAGRSEAASRYLKLPDSSVVILHAGSTLKMYDSSFGGKTREVALNGTAYFDIHHMNNKPFIIHTGDIKVTVLGTAFNIKENGDSIAVTVTRGKVKVENADKVIAVLTPNQQVVYTPQKQQVVQQEVKADVDIKWIRTGLALNGETLDTIAEKLQNRYGVSIHFANPAIGKCRVTVLEAFSGTESIDDILSFICPILNATYKASGNQIIIDGPGCDR